MRNYPGLPHPIDLKPRAEKGKHVGKTWICLFKTRLLIRMSWEQGMYWEVTSLLVGKKVLEAKNSLSYLLLLVFERSAWHLLIQVNNSLQIIVVFFLSMTTSLLELGFNSFTAASRLPSAGCFNVKVSKFTAFLLHLHKWLKTFLIIFYLSWQTCLCLIYSTIQSLLSIKTKLAQRNRIRRHLLLFLFKTS